MKRIIVTAISALFCLGLSAQSRTIRTINDRWNFTKEGVTTTVNIPHTWNAEDTWDEKPGFYRDMCTYSRKLVINDDLEGRNVYIRFEGANQETELFVNGKSAGKHVGGYTAFIFDVTDLVKNGPNDILVNVTNRHNPDIPPLSADFTFYGGIYRDVELVFTPNNQISNTHYASSGVYITTPSVSEAESIVDISTHLNIADPAKYILSQQIYDPYGKLVAANDTKLKIKKAGKDLVYKQQLRVSACRLWDLGKPEVYRVVTILKNAKGANIDCVENPMGFRTFSFDTEKGFTINGRNVKIMGTNRHQDYKEMGNALTDEMHVRDIKLLKDMGGNFLRIAHYPQDPIVTRICDRSGIVCSVEIPIVNEITVSDAFRENCINMALEMVYQDYNSPSVIIWAYMNEVLIHIPAEGRDEYFKHVTAFAKAIDDAIKAADPYRPTMIPCHSDYKRYKKAGVGEVPDILGWNFYNGWYGRNVDSFPGEIQEIHTLFPDKPFILTEYGAGVDPRLHSRDPKRFDFSAEYGLYFHKSYIDVIKNTPFVAGSNVWNLNDFYAEPRVDAVPHVNNKGLVGLDRVPKDSYRLYQANLLDTPVVWIGGRNWTIREGNEGEKQEYEVYSNCRTVSLFHNGTLVGTASPVKGVTAFTICLKDGDNFLKATGEGCEDAVHIRYTAIPKDMSRFTEMNVMLGSDRYFQDDVSGTAWMPEQEYSKGSWGYVGGAKFLPRSGSGPKPSSVLDILGTINDPVFQTQRIGIESFKADVPAGKYYVYLYFAELAVTEKGKPLPYNLGNDVIGEEETERVFSVSINGRQVLKDFNIREEYGARTAVIEKFTADVNDAEGLTVEFTPVKGYSILNAIRIYKAL